ncbi:MAG: DUF1722 domain-containing protein [SAR324 cluster bacterium]|nr:DUF1722 domain-containing protein [SAR324 cluster bacterium]
MNQIRPIVVVSQCLEFEACRYNGQAMPNDFVRKLNQYVDFKKVCPEVAIGMGIPREPIRVVMNHQEKLLKQPATGLDFTQKMRDFSHSFVNELADVDGFLLKGRSPSCGIKDVKIFPAIDSKIPIGKSSGLFAEAVVQKFEGLAIEDEGRLHDVRIREHFLTKLFTLARFRQVKQSKNMAELVQFQSENKLLLMAYNQAQMRVLGRLVANPDKMQLSTILPLYESELKKAFSRPARISNNINALMHALGYFSKQLQAREKAFFLDALENYRNEKSSFSVIAHLLRSWIVRFETDYLAQQTFFMPFPDDLNQ